MPFCLRVWHIKSLEKCLLDGIEVSSLKFLNSVA